MYQLAIVPIFLHLAMYQNFLVNCNVFIQNERKIFMPSKNGMSFNQAFSTCESQSMTVEKNWTESCDIAQNVSQLWLGQVVNGAEDIKWTDGTPPTQGVNVLPSLCNKNSDPCCAFVHCQHLNVQFRLCANSIHFVCSLHVPMYQMDMNRTLHELNQSLNQSRIFANEISSNLKKLKNRIEESKNERIKPISGSNTNETKTEVLISASKNVGINLNIISLAIAVISLILVVINWFFLKRQIDPKTLEKRIKRMDTKRGKKMAEEKSKRLQEYNGPFQMVELPPDSDDDDLPLPPPPPPDPEMLAITNC